MKIDGSVLEEKIYFKILGLALSSKLDWGSYMIFIAKTISNKIGALIGSMRVLSLDVTLNLLYAHVWNTVVTSGVVALVATWNC